MTRPLVMLTDLQRLSYRITGDLWRRSFATIGQEIIELQTPDNYTDRRQLAERFAGHIVFHNTLGELFEPLSGACNIALPAHEWDRYPSPWIDRLNHFEQVWTNSQHVYRVLERCGLNAPLYWQPMALDTETFAQKSDWQPAHPFRLLACGEPHFRKGWHLLLAGFQEAFPKPGEAVLTIKTSAACDWHSSREDIVLNKKLLSREDMLKLYSQQDAFVTASLAEGLGLPLAEAILCGLPVLANAWGGHLSLLTRSGYQPIAFDEVDQPFCSKPDYYSDGQKCALSRPSMIAAAMRGMFQLSADQRQQMAIAARQGLLSRYGKTIVSEQLQLRLQELKRLL